MKGLTRLISTMALAGLIFLLAGIFVHVDGSYPKNLDTVLSLIGGVLGMLGGLIGFSTRDDNPFSENH